MQHNKSLVQDEPKIIGNENIMMSYQTSTLTIIKSIASKLALGMISDRLAGNICPQTTLKNMNTNNDRKHKIKI